MIKTETTLFLYNLFIHVGQLSKIQILPEKLYFLYLDLASVPGTLSTYIEFQRRGCIIGNLEEIMLNSSRKHIV